MAGYDDTYQMIISTLMGRPVGTEIQPDSQQAYEINMLNYIRSLELIANGPLIGIAEANTQPIQPNDARACYIAGVAQDRTVTFQNFRNYLGQPIQITNGQMEACLVILIWDTQYWSATQVPTNIISAAEQANFYYSYNIRKTYPSVAAMNADKDNPIGTDGKYIKVGDIVTVVNSTTPSENGIYSRTEDGWQFQSGMNFALVQETGTDPNVAMSQKVTTEKLTELERGGIYDVSAHNGGAVFESLQSLLSSSDLSTLIPTSVRYGGMSIRFIQGSVPNSDNKYVQYRYMGTATTGTPNPFLNTANWQGVDNKPVNSSNSLVTSGVVDEINRQVNGESEFPFSYRNSGGVSRGMFIVPFEGKSGDTITFALQSATLGGFYVYPVGSDESVSVPLSTGSYTLVSDIDRVTFYISGTSGDTSTHTDILSLTTNGAIEPRLSRMENSLQDKVDNADVQDLLVTPSTTNIVNYPGANRIWVEGYYDHRGIVGTHQTYKLCLDFIEVYANREYVANVGCRVICYNKSKGYCSQIDVTANVAFTIPSNVGYIRVCSTNALNLNIHLVSDVKVLKNDEDVAVTEEYFKQDNRNVLKLTPDFKNGKFRLFTKFTIDEDINTTNGEDKTIVKFKNSHKEVSFFVHKEKAIPFTETVTLRGVSLNLSYPLPRFKSHFGYTNGTNTRNYEDRTFPIFNPICGDWLFYVRYTGNDMEYSTLKMTIGNNSISIVDVDVFNLGDTTTVEDVVASLNSASEYIEAVANPQCVDVLVKNNLVNCADIPLITNSLVNNQDYSEGTFNDAYPAYVFGKKDNNTHTFEIVSDGIDCYAVFDGQNDGQSRLSNVDNYLSKDIIPMLSEGCDVYIGGSETRVEISNTIEYVKLDLNTTGDAEIARNHRIVSNNNPLRVALMGHEMWDGKELDGIIPTTNLLPNAWKSKVADPSIASSTERIKKIFKTAKDKGFEFVNPLTLLNNGSKRRMFMCFDDYEIENYYTPELRKVFDESNAVSTFAIQEMDRFITDETEQKKINNLYLNGWSPVIHGYNADRICQMTYNQLYTDDVEVDYSLAQNIEKARQYNLIERVWVYASGAQNYNGIMAFKQKAMNIGVMINIGAQYYICDASNPLYLKRQNGSDKDTFRSIIEESFVDSELSQVIINSSSVSGNVLTVAFEEINLTGNIETIERGICCRLAAGGVPTLKNLTAVVNGPTVAKTGTANITLTSGIYNVRAWARNAKGISYSDMITVEVS